ncbi:hypothetical protein [Hyphomicrobium sp.]|uniref:hypothetical protein n=1 Tax=Hyphomicrobium sp. TaxID=82 RepID=UPI001D8EEF9E|nr:hypothetical protein [Hyphomicrobium sp.]MBY0561454.1 hypothetical protein [Hyphomicrobium sp.]
MTKVEGPETIFQDDAQPMLRRIAELETYGAADKRKLAKAKKKVLKAVKLMDDVFAGLR